MRGYNLPCEHFYKSFGKQVALRAKNLEDEAIWLERVKRRRKCREDFWQTLLDIFLNTPTFLLSLLVMWGKIFAHTISFVIVAWLFFSFVSYGCYGANYGKSPIRVEENDFYHNFFNFLSTMPTRMVNDYYEIFYKGPHTICKNPWISAYVENLRIERVKSLAVRDDKNILDGPPGPQNKEPGVCLVNNNPGGPTGAQL